MGGCLPDVLRTPKVGPGVSSRGGVGNECVMVPFQLHPWFSDKAHPTVWSGTPTETTFPFRHWISIGNTPCPEKEANQKYQKYSGRGCKMGNNFSSNVVLCYLG